MAKQESETTLAVLEEAMMMQVEVAVQLQVLTQSQGLLARLARTWARITHDDRLAYEDQVLVQVQVLREAMASIEQLHRTMGRALQLLKWHQRQLEGPDDR